MELLTQAVEALSILTTKKFATKEPRRIKRPEWVQQAGSQAGSMQGPTEPSRRNPFARAIDRIFSFGAPGRHTEGEYVGMPPPHLRESMP